MTPVSPANIGLYWTDEELFLSLEKITEGSSIPENVTADVNPYHHMPSNLPDAIWYFIRSEQKKESEHGFWKARGEACEVFVNSSIIGWRTTLEFYEGKTPHGRRTNWVMQEYRITQRGLCSNSNPKGSGSLCRVFLSLGANPKQEMQLKIGDAGNGGGNQLHPKASVVPDAGCTPGQGCISESQARNRDDDTRPLAAAGELPDITVQNMSDVDIFSRGDYLELDDLADPGSLTSSSYNTSCRTLSSDECFDSLSLLQDLEDELNRHQQGKDANSKFSVAASVKPNEVVMQPATLGALSSCSERKPPAEAIKEDLSDKMVSGKGIKSRKVGEGHEGTSKSPNVATSSSSHKPVPKGVKRSPAGTGRMEKLKRKYWCFMPF